MEGLTVNIHSAVQRFFVCIGHRDGQDVTRSSLCSGVRECGTKRAHNFLFPKSSSRIRRTTVVGMVEDSAIILDAIRRSFLTKSATAAMFISVWVDFGRPPLSSSSTSFLLSRNPEYHLKTFDQFTALFPLAFYTNTSFCVADRPALKQNVMATLFISAIHDAWRKLTLQDKL